MSESPNCWSGTLRIKRKTTPTFKGWGRYSQTWALKTPPLPPKRFKTAPKTVQTSIPYAQDSAWLLCYFTGGRAFRPPGWPEAFTQRTGISIQRTTHRKKKIPSYAELFCQCSEHSLASTWQSRSKLNSDRRGNKPCCDHCLSSHFPTLVCNLTSHARRLRQLRQNRVCGTLCTTKHNKTSSKTGYLHVAAVGYTKGTTMTKDQRDQRKIITPRCVGQSAALPRRQNGWDRNSSAGRASDCDGEAWYWRGFESLVRQGIFLPESTFSADSPAVSMQPPCGIACRGFRAQVKNPEHWQPHHSLNTWK